MRGEERAHGPRLEVRQVKARLARMQREIGDAHDVRAPEMRCDAILLRLGNIHDPALIGCERGRLRGKRRGRAGCERARKQCSASDVGHADFHRTVARP